MECITPQIAVEARVCTAVITPSALESNFFLFELAYLEEKKYSEEFSNQH